MAGRRFQQRHVAQAFLPVFAFFPSSRRSRLRCGFRAASVSDALDIADNRDRSRQVINYTLEFLKSNLTKTSYQQVRPVLTSKNCYSMMAEGRTETAERLLRDKVKESQVVRSGNPFFCREISASSLNLTGKDLLQSNKIAEAIEVFHQAVEKGLRVPPRRRRTTAEG